MAAGPSDDENSGVYPSKFVIVTMLRGGTVSAGTGVGVGRAEFTESPVVTVPEDATPVRPRPISFPDPLTYSLEAG